MKPFKSSLSLLLAACMLLALVPASAQSLPESNTYAMELTEEDCVGRLVETDLPSGIYDDGKTLIIHPDDGGMIMSYDSETGETNTVFTDEDKSETRSPNDGFPYAIPNSIDEMSFGAFGLYPESSGYLTEFGELDPDAEPISTAYELYQIRNGENGKSYYLTRNIDVSDLARYGIEWEPISVGCTLDGRGHTVKGLTDSLFEYAYRVKNITVIVNSNNCLGGIARRTYTNYSQIRNCIVKGSIFAGEEGACGGIVGRVVASGSPNYVISVNPVISYCINYASVTAENYAGGIIGQTSYSSLHVEDVGTYTTVEFCLNKGRIKSQEVAGGIVGGFDVCNIRECINEGEVSIPNASFTGGANNCAAAGIAGVRERRAGTISSCTNKGRISGFNAYGICAYYASANDCRNEADITGFSCAAGIGCGGFSYCVNYGAVTSQGRAYGIGVWGFDNYCSQCVNRGAVSAQSSESKAYAAGIGLFKGISSCCNTGSVSAYSSADSAYAGGIFAASGSLFNITYCAVISQSITARTTSSSGEAYAGGIIGYLDHTGYGTPYFGCFICDTPNIGAYAVQDSYAYAGAFVGYNNVNYSQYVGYLATKACLTTSDLPFSGRQGNNPAYNVIHIDSLSECRKEVTVKVVHSETDKPLKHAVVNLDGNTVQTDENGMARVPVYFNHALLLAVSMNMFECKKIVHPDLDNGTIVVKIGYNGESDGLEHDYVVTPSGDEVSIEHPSLGQQILSGPSLTFRGEESNAYQIEIGIDLPFGEIACEYDKEEDTLKILIGFKNMGHYSGGELYDDFNEDWNDVVDGFKLQSPMQFEKAQTSDTIVAFKCEAAVLGYMLLGTNSNGEMKFIEGGCQVGLKLKVPSAKHGLWNMVYVQLIVSGSADGVLKISKGEVTTGKYSGEVTFVATLTGKACANLLNLVSAEIGFNASFYLKILAPFTKLEESLEIGSKLDVFFSGRALFWHENKTWDIYSAKLFPQEKALEVIDLDSVLCSEAMKPMPRDYLKDMGLKSGGSESLVINGVFSESEPQLAQLADGRLVLVWAHDDGTRTDMNRTAIYYSVYDNGAWSAPAMLYDDGTADFSPQIAVEGSDLHVVWQNMSEVLADDAELDYAITKTQICHTVLHADGSVDTPEVICPEGKYQSKIKAAACNGRVCVVWVQNSANDIWCDNGYSSVCFTEFDGSEWSAPASVPYEAVDAACGYRNGNYFIVYTKASSNGAASGFDLYLYDASGISSYATNNSVEDSNPQIINGVVYWQQDGVLRNSSGTLGLECEGDVKLTAAADGTLTAFMKGCGEGFNTEIMTAVRDNATGEWSPFVPLTNYGGLLTYYFPVVMADGNIAVALTEAPLTGDEDVYGNSSLRVILGASYTDLVLTDNFAYDFDAAAPGGEITLTGSVYNNSMGAIDGLTVNVYDENDTLISTESIDILLASGESAEISFPFTLPDPLSFAELRAEVLPALVTDDEQINNSSAFMIGMCDLAVSGAGLTEDPTGAEIVATVESIGFDTAYGVNAELRYGGADGELLDSVSLGDMAPGALRALQFTVPTEYLANDGAFDYNYFRICVTTESPQAHYYNDWAVVHDDVVRAEGVEITSQPAQLYVFDTYALAANVLPAEASDRSVTWISSDLSVLTVDEDGVVTAVGAGTATIYAVSNDGGFVDSIELSAVYRQYTAAFLDHDGTVLLTVTLNEGEVPEPPAEPEREGYAFIGWNETPCELHDNVTFTAQYEICVYEIWYFVLDELYLVEEYEYGAPITVPAAPAETEHCDFISWPELPENMPAHDIIAYAEVDPYSYTVTFLGMYGEVVEEQQVVYGNAAVPPEPPEYEGYTFTGWSADLSYVTGDMTVTALYDTVMLTVTFVDWDGAELCVIVVPYGGAAEAPEPPVREGFTFVGWDTDFSYVTQDLTVTALYEPEAAPVSGDVDGDGIFSFTDISALSLFLIGSGSIANEPAADYNGDGQVNFLDIADMYIALIG